MDLLDRLGRNGEAAEEFDRAVALSGNSVERDLCASGPGAQHLPEPVGASPTVIRPDRNAPYVVHHGRNCTFTGGKVP